MPNIETQIDRATVYTDRAQVTRKGTIQLEPGSHRVELQSLPKGLMPETVRARAMSTVRVRLVATDAVRTYHREPPQARQADFEARLLELQQRDEVLVRGEAAIGTRRGFVQSLANASGTEIARGIAFGRVTVEAGASVAVLITEQLAALDAESVTISRERREIALEMGVLKSQLKSVQQRKPVERQSVVVQVEMEAAGELALEVSYQVYAASWTPFYDIRVSEKGDRPLLALTYQAQVTQQTGEDWDSVALTLSTAKPAASSVLPELRPWYLRAHQAFFTKRSMPPAAAMLDEEAEVYDEAPVTVAGPASFAMQEAVIETASVTESGPAVSFGISGRTGVPSDGSPHKVTLASPEFPARLDYVTAPKLINQAFRRARAINETKLILLPGSAQVFYEDEFVGGTRLKTLAPGQEVELYLGVDDRVHVERKLVAGTVDRKFLADVRRSSYSYEVSVTNLREGPQTVTILDQLPVSRHESIKVRRGEVRPEPAEQTDLGSLRWELLLEPRQSRTARFAFTVEAPRDLAFIGLPPSDEGTD